MLRLTSPFSVIRGSSSRCGLVALVLWLATAWFSEALAADKVYPRNAVPISGKIVKLSPFAVSIEVRGKNQDFSLADVEKIAFDAEPDELSRARDHLLNGQVDQALLEIKKIDLAEVQNPVIKQDVEFYRWYSEGRLALGGTGDKNAAIKGLRAIGNANRNTHHLFDLSEMLGELAMSVGQMDTAASYFGILLNAPDETTKAQGSYRLAQVDLGRNKLTEAKERFQQLVGSDNASPEMARIKRLAEVGLAVCEQREGESQVALSKLEAMISKYPSSDQELHARISNAQGACYQAMSQPTDALLSYLKTDLMFFTEPEAHAEALYHLKTLWSEYGKPAKAADAAQRLETLYASSTWANK